MGRENSIDFWRNPCKKKKKASSFFPPLHNHPIIFFFYFSMLPLFLLTVSLLTYILLLLVLPPGSAATWVSICLWRGWWSATWPVGGESRRQRRRGWSSWRLLWHPWTREEIEMGYYSNMMLPSAFHSNSTTTHMRETRWNHCTAWWNPCYFTFTPIGYYSHQLISGAVGGSRSTQRKPTTPQPTSRFEPSSF